MVLIIIEKGNKVKDTLHLLKCITFKVFCALKYKTKQKEQTFYQKELFSKRIL